MDFLITGWGAGDRISGGMDVHILKTAENLARKGHKVTLFVSSGCDGLQNGVNVLNAGMPAKLRLIEEFISAVSEYNEKIVSLSKGLDFGCVLSHDWIGVAAAGKIRKTRGVRWIHTVHSLEHMRSLKDDSEKSEITDLEREGIVSADAVFTVSRLMAQEISAKYGIKAEVVYNGPSFDEPAKKRDSKGSVILYTGRLTAQKGVEYLILASKRILEKFPSARFVIAGEGDLKEPLETFAYSLGVSDSFEFLGFVPKEKLIELYSEASVFVSPSIYEPFGITILDAVSFSCPVVATKNTGALELFSDGITIVEPQDSTSLGDAVIRALGNRAEFDKKAENAKRAVEGKDFWEIAAEDIEKKAL